MRNTGKIINSKSGHTYTCIYFPTPKNIEKGCDVHSLSRGQWASRGRGINPSPSRPSARSCIVAQHSASADRLARAQEQQQYEESPGFKERNVCVQ